ncbi:MvdC/MvdD family ATP grasp protein [Streptomyces iconiensis]|uniref:MvdD-like pre-ATP grasp domain-containing protein n=1 Tax=Streptomyces iconiensis TaxID=1384038 RepID=A0ABT6ZWT1_9ACTN|nr:hypothetical protein [Streptomyces iconiensis]MDJ1133530.1 hypothetical protein [Streptomyces iconiensis]
MSTVLVVDGPADRETALLVEGLTEAGVHAVRLDTADFPSEVELRATHGEGAWTGTLTTREGGVELSEIAAVYWNRPGLFTFPELSEPDAAWACEAARIGFGGVLSGLHTRWMNHPGRASAAEFMPQQMLAARSAGLDTPRTLITNSAEEVARFAGSIRGPLLTKPLGSRHLQHTGGTETVRTRVVDLDDLKGVELTAHLFQEQVVKDYEAHLVCVGGACHAARIDTCGLPPRLDRRSGADDLDATPVETPAHVAAAVRSFTAALGLSYASLDFAVRPDGTWTFLNSRSSGPWECPRPLTGAVVREFVRTLAGWCGR